MCDTFDGDFDLMIWHFWLKSSIILLLPPILAYNSFNSYKYRALWWYYCMLFPVS